MTTTVYTDGACIGNPGPGGWAWAVPEGAFASGADPATTNQRMEIRAAYEAARAIPGRLHVVSDSTYVVKCFNDRWFDGWIARGWKNASRQPVANQDLWRPFIDLYRDRAGELTFAWVKGHSGDTMNDVVDRLATEAARTQSGRSADTPPTTLGDADTPGIAMSADVAATAEVTEPAPSSDGTFRVVAFGVRPPALGGYDPDNPVAADVARRVGDVLGAWQALHPAMVVLTGLGLGAEQLVADECLRRSIPYDAVLPFPDPDRMWPAQSRERYRRLVAGARKVVTLESTVPAGRQDAGRALGRRDRWLTGQADGAVVVWDGTDRSVGALVAALERRDVDLFPIAPST